MTLTELLVYVQNDLHPTISLNLAITGGVQAFIILSSLQMRKVRLYEFPQALRAIDE